MPICALLSVSIAHAGDRPYIEKLVKAADERQLHRHRYWETLGHYKPALSGVKSLVDDPAFFMAANGRRDPKGELEATLEGFFQDSALGDKHPRCRFRGRYEWLRDELHIDEGRLPAVSCSEFDDASGKIKPESAALIFPAAYMNSPGSMFGHTLIRIDTTYQSKLLSYAASYAAHADDTNGILYAVKGIFGYYKGLFSLRPYYDKVKEYNDMEQRDMWEYKLNLTPGEVRRMLNHLWELKDIYSSYYFFDENCAYQLLFLLEAARPTLHLTDRFGAWVIPIDTLRVVRDAGLVEAVEYRPSQGMRIRRIASSLNEKGIDAGVRLANWKGEADELPPSDAGVLDLSAEVLQYRYGKRELSRDEYQKAFLSILSARSQLGRPAEDPYPITPPPKPETGHPPGRISIGAGFKQGDFFEELRYRPANHDLSDPDAGYLPGAQIVFMGTALRHSSEEGVKLESLDLIDIVSISPRDRVFKPLSWKVRTGINRKIFHDGKEHAIYRLNPGAGMAWQDNSPEGGLYYCMLETDLVAGEDLDGHYALGVGPSVGVIKKLTREWTINLSAGAMYYEAGDTHRTYRAAADQIFRINRNQSASFGVSARKEFDRGKTEFKLSWNFYF